MAKKLVKEMKIGDRTFELRKDRGMSQKKLSALTGIAKSAISDWK